MKLQFGFKTVWIVASPREEDYKSARELHEQVRDYHDYVDEDLLVEFLDVADKSEFFAALEKIYSDVATTGNVPFLHIDTHGSVRGIELRSKEFVTFRELMPAMKRINEQCCNNLFVAVAACEGEYFVTTLGDSFLRPASFCGMIGPSEEIGAGEMSDGYKAFYREVFESRDLNKALDALVSACPQSGSKFHLWSSEQLFLKTLRNYFHYCCTPEIVTKRINRMLALGRRDGLQNLSDEEFRERVTRTLRDEAEQRRTFERLKAEFFMYSRCPENSARFCPTFEDVMRMKVEPMTEDQVTALV